MQKIQLPCVFGKNTECTLVKGSDISLTINEDHIVTRTNYVYETKDDLDLVVEKRVNEKSFIKKEFISQMAAGYDDKEGVYFIAIVGVGFDSFINVESAEKGNEVLNSLTGWWLG